jgi:hypothetical protein
MAQSSGLQDALFNLDGIATVHHSRYSREDRPLLDKEVEKQIGKKREESLKACIVVGTQTLEQSLDIDADLLITDLCPMDVLLQRVGRLHRHDRKPEERPENYRYAQAVVLVPAGGSLEGCLEKSRHGLGRFHNGGGKALKEAVAAWLKEKDEKKNIEAMKLGSGLESALFGRMVTSDVLTSRDAAVYVAHAFTVHEAQVENDYFTVVDDLLRESGELGSAGIFDTELASGLYYGYVVVDVPQLVANLEGVKIEDCFKVGADQRELAAKVVHHLLHLIATVSPGAKRGSTAPFEWAKLMLVEAGDWQPRSLAGAFQNALDTDGDKIRERAVGQLADELQRLDAAYGAPSERRFLSVDDCQVPGAERLPLASLTQWVQDRIVSGAVQGA